jgi:L-glyceraldehyde 3-phosphate reductase
MHSFSTLAQGLLKDKYVEVIPENSRASNPTGHLRLKELSLDKVEKITALNEIAQKKINH